MDKIINYYSNLIDSHKLIFKSLLGDISTSIKYQEELQNGKRVINHNEIEKSIQQANFFGEKELRKQLSNEEIEYLEQEEVQKELIIELIGIKDLVNDKIIQLELHGDKLNLYNELIKLGFIKKSQLEVLKGFLEYENDKDNFMYLPLIAKKAELEKIHGKELIDSQLKNARKIIPFVKEFIVNKNDHFELLELINLHDTQSISYKDHVLFYGGKIAYSPTKYSNRDVFLEFIFQYKVLEYLSMRDILNNLEGGGIELTKKRAGTIYKLKDDLNKTIYRKIKEIDKNFKIEELFTLGKGDNTGKICRML